MKRIQKIFTHFDSSHPLSSRFVENRRKRERYLLKFLICNPLVDVEFLIPDPSFLPSSHRLYLLNNENTKEPNHKVTHALLYSFRRETIFQRAENSNHHEAVIISYSTRGIIFSYELMSRETFNDRTIAGGDASTNGYLPASNSPVRSRFDFFRKKGETWFRGSTEKKYQRFTEQYTATRPEWNNEADNEAFRTRFSALFLILCDGSVGDA